MKIASIVKSYISSDDNLVVTIPQAVRRDMKIKIGTRFLVKFDNKAIVYELLKEDTP